MIWSNQCGDGIVRFIDVAVSELDGGVGWNSVGIDGVQ